MDRPSLAPLTGIRFFAALWVVFFHYAPALPPPFANVAANGHLAVGFFFILSGFVLAYNHAGRPISVRRFWGARLARIYPAYLLGFVLIAPAVAVRLRHSDAGRAAAAGPIAAAMLQGWFPKFALLWNGPGWSLSDEAFFYLLFPAILPVIACLPSRRIRIVPAACWAAALAAPTLYLLLPGFLSAEAVMYMPLFHLAEFVLGVALGAAYARRPPAAGLGPATVALAIGVYAAFSPMWIHPILRGAFAMPLFAALVPALASCRGRLARLLSWDPIRRLGEASYAIYILQSPAMAWFLFATRGTSAAGWRTRLDWAEFAIYSAILIAAALATHNRFETPARRWIQSWPIFRGAEAGGRCKMELDPYESPDSAAASCRSLLGLRSEV